MNFDEEFSFASKAKSSKSKGSRRTSSLFGNCKNESMLDSPAKQTSKPRESPMIEKMSESIIDNKEDGKENFGFCNIFKNRLTASPSGDPFLSPLYSKKSVRMTPSSKDSVSQKLVSSIINKDDDVAKLRNELLATQEKLVVSESNHQMTIEEVNMVQFLNSIQEQRIEQLEQQLSTDRMTRNEAFNNRVRKHKAVVRKLQQDRADYEARAEAMYQQVNGQMAQLQGLAMQRIETLEKELMAQRHSNTKLEAQCAQLRTTSVVAMASLEKQRKISAAALAARAAAMTQCDLYARQLIEVNQQQQISCVNDTSSLVIDKVGITTPLALSPQINYISSEEYTSLECSEEAATRLCILGKSVFANNNASNRDSTASDETLVNHEMTITDDGSSYSDDDDDGDSEVEDKDGTNTSNDITGITMNNELENQIKSSSSWESTGCCLDLNYSDEQQHYNYSEKGEYYSCFYNTTNEEVVVEEERSFDVVSVVGTENITNGKIDQLSS